MMSGQGSHLIPVAQGPGPNCLAMEADRNLVSRFPLPARDRAGDAHLLGLGVKTARKQEKLLMFEGKSGFPLVNAALAQEDCLLTGSQCLTHALPLFKSNCHPPFHPPKPVLSK